MKTLKQNVRIEFDVQYARVLRLTNQAFRLATRDTQSPRALGQRIARHLRLIRLLDEMDWSNSHSQQRVATA